MDDLDKELDALTDALRDDEHEQAARRLFEESKVWDDHRKWHDKQGTPARMEMWEEPAKQQPTSTLEEQAPKPRTVIVAGCACQHHNPLIRFEEGQVTGELRQPAVEQTSYGSTPSGSVTYSGNQPAQDTTYTANPANSMDLYR